MCVCLHVKRRQGRRWRSTGRPLVRARARNTVCERHVTVCVCLNYLAQRPDRGVNEVRSSLLQRFSSLHPSISTPSTHQPSSSSSSSSVAAELLVYSACLNKQELSNKRLPTCYSCPLNYGQAALVYYTSSWGLRYWDLNVALYMCFFLCKLKNPCFSWIWQVITFKQFLLYIYWSNNSSPSPAKQPWAVRVYDYKWRHCIMWICYSLAKRDSWEQQQHQLFLQVPQNDTFLHSGDKALQQP